MAEPAFVGAGSLGQALENGSRLLATDPAAAAAQAQEILRIDPDSRPALRLLAEAYRRLGRTAEAEAAEYHAVRAASRDPVVGRAAAAIGSNRLEEAEHDLRPYLKANPGDPAAVALLAEIANRLGIYHEAESMLLQVLEIVPGFLEARLNLAGVLFRQNRLVEAIEVHDKILAAAPDNIAALRSKATLLGDLGRYDDARLIHERLVALAPDQADLWMSYGHLLKTIGRTGEAVVAYRTALKIRPDHGETWWSLANLKTFKFGSEDLRRVESSLRDGGDTLNTLHLHFTLGKLFEDRGEFVRSFHEYQQGNHIRRSMTRYDPKVLASEVQRSQSLFSADFFEKRRGWGNPAPDPIFILGMPRAGSTLVEQILATHSAIEGTSELPYLQALVRSLVAARWQSRDISYPELLAAFEREEMESLGSDYLARASQHRRTGKPLFTDKMPNNWTEIGFIHLILPNARIIDVRRHPLDCCLSIFKQHFARGQSFAYSLEEIGHQYRHYVELLAHFDTVLPGRVYRIIHEQLIDDPEAEVRRLFAYLGLPFDTTCLRFHENERPVRTASSEQVRQPINRQGMNRWENYDAWLEPLKRALGPVLDSYPDPPSSF